MKVFIELDNTQEYYVTSIEDAAGIEVNIPSDLYDRYNLALLEWDAVQEEIDKYYKGEYID